MNNPDSTIRIKYCQAPNCKSRWNAIRISPAKDIYYCLWHWYDEYIREQNEKHIRH